MRALYVVIHEALELYKWAIIIVALMSWLISFNVINIHNNMVRSIWNGLNGLVEPALRQIRRFLPAMGGLDISPIILIFVIWFVQMELTDLFRRIVQLSRLLPLRPNWRPRSQAPPPWLRPKPKPPRSNSVRLCRPCKSRWKLSRHRPSLPTGASPRCS